LIQDTAALDSIVAQIAFWSEFFSKLLMAFADWTCEPVKLTFVSETVAFFI